MFPSLSATTTHRLHDSICKHRHHYFGARRAVISDVPPITTTLGYYFAIQHYSVCLWDLTVPRPVEEILNCFVLLRYFNLSTKAHLLNCILGQVNIFFTSILLLFNINFHNILLPYTLSLGLPNDLLPSDKILYADFILPMCTLWQAPLTPSTSS